jgi:hypothetical protein
VKNIFLLLLLLLSAWKIQAQEHDIVEVSGIATARNDKGRIEFVPFVNVLVQGVNRGTYANYEGMFSIVVKKGQSLRFTAIGYKEKIIEVPQNIEGKHYTMVVELEATAIQFDDIIVFPWPNRDNFKAEFLAMDPNMAMQMEAIARKNLDERNMMAIREITRMDSRENAVYYLRKQARDYSYQGQIPPMRIFDPLAWNEFFQSLSKNKKNKNKKKEPTENWGNDD